ncbi:hypothetical protein PSYJA_39545 [Pseudomonas syringae pv. japonica str. M301072]|uniref:Uncharacterized protein n=1 Tax=Pseudomonas syringae pv. japonica str. M301072 TaxID=629262 RepID=F3FWZ5_PSESX|nr:hypothetical protein PSYJA_39545 [Pseudomonas syringae pv. japonica str. M301072]
MSKKLERFALLLGQVIVKTVLLCTKLFRLTELVTKAMCGVKQRGVKAAV